MLLLRKSWFPFLLLDDVCLSVVVFGNDYGRLVPISHLYKGKKILTQKLGATDFIMELRNCVDKTENTRFIHDGMSVSFFIFGSFQVNLLTTLAREHSVVHL